MKEYMSIHNGVPINYICNNSNADRSIFLIHGYGGWSGRWIPLMDKFSSQRIFSVDLPGYNKSGKLEQYSTESVANIMVDFVQSNINEENLLIGHSWGAWIAYEMAKILERKIDGVLLEDPGWMEKWPDVKDLPISRFIIENKPKWITPIDAINSFREHNPDIFKENQFDACIRAVLLYVNDINLTMKFDLKDQDYRALASAVKTKTYIARGNTNKGGLLSDEVKREVMSLNQGIVVSDFDTGHDIMSGDAEGYFDFVRKFLT